MYLNAKIVKVVGHFFPKRILMTFDQASEAFPLEQCLPNFCFEPPNKDLVFSKRPFDKTFSQLILSLNINVNIMELTTGPRLYCRQNILTIKSMFLANKLSDVAAVLFHTTKSAQWKIKFHYVGIFNAEIVKT